MVHLAQLLSQCVMADKSTTGEASGGQDAPMTNEMDEVVELKDSVRVDPFQTPRFLREEQQEQMPFIRT